MLPHINADNGDLSTDNWVLVLGCDDAQRAPVLHEPAPAAPLNAEKGSREGLLELFEVSPGLADLDGEGWSNIGVCLGRGGRDEVLPEEGVVDVSSTVELDGSLQGDLGGDIVGRHGQHV